jgi:hypothetical protein
MARAERRFLKGNQMIRLNDQQAGQLADLFDHLNEVFSLMNTFIDDASSGKVNPDHAAQLRSRTTSIRESAAQVAEMLAEGSKRTKSDRSWANHGSAVKFGGFATHPTAGASRKSRGAGKKTTPSGS